MRNEKNVAALAALIAQVTDAVRMDYGNPDAPWEKRKAVTPEIAQTIAEQIGDSGVIVPSTIGQDPDDAIQFDMVIDTDEAGEVEVVNLVKLREALERIARGDPHPYRLDTGRNARETAEQILRDLDEPTR